MPTGDHFQVLNCAGNIEPVCKCRAVEQKLDLIIAMLDHITPDKWAICHHPWARVELLPSFGSAGEKHFCTACKKTLD